MSLSFYAPSRFYGDDWLVADTQPSNLVPFHHHKHNNINNALAPLLSVDLIESETDFHVHADLPGVEPSDLELTVEGRTLVIKAERKHVHKVDTDKVHSTEKTYGKVQRSFRLPNNVDLDKVESTFRNGVLSISVPKVTPPEPTSRKIEVNVQA